MKKLFIGYLFLCGLQAQATDWDLIAERALVMTDINRCYKSKTTNCESLVVKALALGIERKVIEDEVLLKNTKNESRVNWDSIASEAALAVDQRASENKIIAREIDSEIRRLDH